MSDSDAAGKGKTVGLVGPRTERAEQLDPPTGAAGQTAGPRGEDGDGRWAHFFFRGGSDFLFDPATATLFRLDGPGLAAALEVLGAEAVWRGPRAQPVAEEDRRAAVAQIRALEAQGCFRHVQWPQAPAGIQRPLSIAPLLSYRCNLRCRYCFVDHAHPGRPPEMSRAVMEATVRFITEQNAAAWRPEFPWDVCLAPIGEPTLSMPLFEQFAELLAEEGRRHGLRLRAGIDTTNLTTLEQPVVSRHVRDVSGSVSLDGPSQAHDAMRVHPDGRGTYADAIRGLELLRANGARPYPDATLTAAYPDVSEVYFHLFGLGFDEVLVKPVRAKPHEPYAIGQNIEAICAGYGRFAERLLALSDDQLLRRLLGLMHVWLTGGYVDDYFGRFLVRVIERHALDRRCPAWVGQLVVDTDGRLYGCASLTGVEEAGVGSVQGGLDEARVQQLADGLHVSRRSPCNRCWAQRFCGGGCMYQSYLTHGRFEPPDPAECALNQHLIELALWLMAELRHSRPQVFSALPRIAKAQWRLASTVWCPHLGATTPGGAASRLAAAEPSGVIAVPSSLKKRLPGDQDQHEVEVRVAWDQLRLYLLLTPRHTDAPSFWERIRQVWVELVIPDPLAREGASLPLAPTAETARWLHADDHKGRVMDCSSIPARPLAGSRVVIGGAGCFVAVPWAEVEMRQPQAGMQLGLQAVLVDAEGGEIIWYPEFRAGKAHLLR